jgi:hypothetical protein
MCEQTQSVCIGKPTKSIWKIFSDKKLSLFVRKLFADGNTTGWRNFLLGTLSCLLLLLSEPYRFSGLVKEPNHLSSDYCVHTQNVLCHRTEWHQLINHMREHISDITKNEWINEFANDMVQWLGPTRFCHKSVYLQWRHFVAKNLYNKDIHT